MEIPRPKTRPQYIKGRRKCIFCGAYGVTKEHLFAEWLRRLFSRDASSKHLAAHISWPEKIISREPIDLRRLLQGHSGTKKVRVVCRQCNNGWMSKLEEWAMAGVPSMAVMERCNITPGGQRRLATWACKTAMVGEHTYPRDIGITQAERTFLMENQTPPDGWFVWVATHRSLEWAELSIFQSRAALSPTPVPGPEGAPYYVQATTFGIGHALFCVVSSSYPKGMTKFQGWEPFGLVQIWPAQPRSIIWPTLDILADSEVHNIANILRKSDAFDHSLDPGAHWTFTGFKRKDT